MKTAYSALLGVVLVCVLVAAPTMANKDKSRIYRLHQASDDVKNVLLGLVTATKDPTINVNNIFDCGFADVADDLEDTLIDLVNEAATCDPSKISDIETKFQAFLDRMPEALTVCLKKNFDARRLMKGLHLDGVKRDQIKKKIITYIENHPQSTCSDLQSFQKNINESNWNQFGKDAGNLIITIFSSSTQQRELSPISGAINKSGFALSSISKPLQNCPQEHSVKQILSELKSMITGASSCDATKAKELIQRASVLMRRFRRRN